MFIQATSLVRGPVRASPTLGGGLRLGSWALVWLGVLLVGLTDARAEPAGSTLRQLCLAAEQLADIEPASEPRVRRELHPAARAELRSAVRAEVQRSLPRDRLVPGIPGAQRADSAAAETHGSAAAAREAAAQAQQARRNQDVAAARSKGAEHASLSGRANGAVPGTSGR